MAAAFSNERRAGTDKNTAVVVWLGRALLAVSAVLFALHFLHLAADFPNNSPWVDWSKYTDEGWYGDAAIRHYLTGHWYWKGDFNPAVALPVWPAIELVWFKFTGVSPQSARALTLIVFALTLTAFYSLLKRFAPVPRGSDEPSLAPALCVFLMCASPFFYVFERMAILEPLLVLLTVCALWCASLLGGPGNEIPDARYDATGDATDEIPANGASGTAAARGIQRGQGRRFGSRIAPLVSRHGPTVALGILLPLMVLTKTTALFLVPAIAYMVWARAGYRLRRFFALGLPPAVIGVVLWVVYFAAFVRPHYLEDYRYLFSANAYTGLLLDPFEKVVLNTIADGMWMGAALYVAFFILLALMLFWRPRLLRNPLLPALLLWALGYVLFLGYHNNLQPRYYLVVAAPLFALVALGLDGFRGLVLPGRQTWSAAAAVAVAVVLIVPGLRYELWMIAHPTYQFRDALNAVAATVRADKTHSPLVLSISGSDLTLFTGVPSIDDDFGTMELSTRANTYKPGWYLAWNELDDDKMDALTPEFHPVRVAAFPALDDPDRNLLILYRLDRTNMSPATPHRRVHHRKPTPKPLETKVGQQPTTEQLEH